MLKKIMMISLVFYVSNAWATDPCDALLSKYGNLGPVLNPRHQISDLEARARRGEMVNILLFTNSIGEVRLQSRSLKHGSQPDLVLVKGMKSPLYSAGNAKLMKAYKVYEESGLLPGFGVFPLLAEEQLENVFPYFEGRELCTIEEDLSDLSNREMRQLRESYTRRLRQTADTLHDKGYRVMVSNPLLGLPELEAWKGGEPVVSINACNIWVTVDGRFMIFDPL